MNTVNIKLYDIFRKDLKLPEDRAKDLVAAIDEAVKEGHTESLNRFATKEDLIREVSAVKTDLSRTIYIVGLVQFLAIVGSVLAIVAFMNK